MNNFFSNTLLPKELTNEEFNRLFNEFKSGNNLAKDKLIKHNIKLVICIVHNTFKYVNYDKDDLVSIGCIGLLKALNTYKISKIKFSTYASKYIQNEILMFLRKLKTKRYEISLDTPILKEKNNNDTLTIKDTISSNISLIDDYLDKEIIIIIDKLINDLPELDKKIMIMYFGFYNSKRYFQFEIADKLNTSQASISRIIKKNIQDLKIKLEKLGLIELKNTINNKVNPNNQSYFK